MRLKQRYAKKILGNQDIEGILEQGEHEVNRIPMNQHYNNDMQNPWKWTKPGDGYHRFATIVKRFLIKRIGRKYDDVFSEFVNRYENNKEFKNIHQSRKIFNMAIDDLKLSIDASGVIVKTPPEQKCKDIIIYKKEWISSYKIIRSNWNAARHILIPMLGFHSFDYYSNATEITEQEFKHLERMFRKSMDKYIAENFLAIKAFSSCGSHNWNFNNDVLMKLCLHDYHRPVERVIKYGTKEYFDYRKEQEKIKKDKIKEKRNKYKEFENDFKEHNRKIEAEKADKWWKEVLKKTFGDNKY